MPEKLPERIRLEIQEVDTLLHEYGNLLAKVRHSRPDLVETTALASVLHSYYTGLEKIFLHIARTLDPIIPDGPEWHRELLDQMGLVLPGRSAVISSKAAEKLDEYLAFRHFYRHGYSFTLDWEKLEGLVAALPGVWAEVKSELERFLEDRT